MLGQAGQPGALSDQRAASGAGPGAAASRGGTGGALADPNGETPPSSDNAGGGGGAAGRIRINSTAQPVVEGIVSPAPSIGPIPSLILPAVMN
ncbi:MAG: hypothetical protein RBU30_26190 [Polyangia bacterium]|nr:hypothetical protein [Polyangia bacterium]